MPTGNPIINKEQTMTVKCLNEIQKSVIADLYLMKLRTINELCKDYHVSRRTLGRALLERGIHSVRPRVKKVQPVQTDWEDSPNTPELVPKPTLLQRIKAFFGRLFY